MSAAWVLGARAPRSGAGRLNWRRAAGYGVLWGVAATAMESFGLPLDTLGAAELLRFEVRLLLQWCGAGIVLARATMQLEHRLTPMLMAPALVAFSLLACAGWVLFDANSLLPTSRLGGETTIHMFWGGLIYGGLFVAAYRLSVQSERTRGLLARAEIARQQTEAALSAARYQSMQGHVDPAFLLRVMVEVERRYAQDPAGVDRLLEPLVAFLRAAMPGVRGSASTLAAEVKQVMQYERVWAELEPGRITWAIRVEGVIPDVPFPALLLLPVLDQLAAADGSAPRAELEVTHSATRCRLTLRRSLSKPDCWLAPDLAHRLQVGLRTLFGEDWLLALGDCSTEPALAISIPLHRAAMPPRGNTPVPSFTHQEMTHG